MNESEVDEFADKVSELSKEVESVVGGDLITSVNPEPERFKTIMYKGRLVVVEVPKEKLGNNANIPSRKERRRKTK